MHTNTKPAKFIKFVTKYEYSHVAISLGKECDVLYSFGRTKVHSILDAGFSIEVKNGEFFKAFNKTKCKIYELEVNDEQYAEVKNIIKDMESNKNEYKYDYFGIVPRYFNIPVTFKNKYVCSYFVASLLEKANIYKFEKEPCFIKPEDFAEVKGLHEIYAGQYHLYKSGWVEIC